MMSHQEHVVISEVGLRDGLQNQPTHVPLEGKLRLAEALVQSGLRNIEATSFVSPRIVPQMADASELMAALPSKQVVDYSTLIPNMKGYERAVSAGAKTVTVVLSATDTMNQKNIGMSLRKTREITRQIIERGAADQITVRGYVAVAFECPFEGRVKPALVQELAQEMLKSGASEVIIADTIGAASPKDAFDLFTHLRKKIPANVLAAHFHDTRAMGLANAWAALTTGIRKFDSSIGGLGGCPFAPGAAGNVATEDLVVLMQQCGFETGIDLPKLLEAVKVASEVTGHAVGGRTFPWLARVLKKS